MRRCRQRDVALAAQQAGGGVEADPARARDIGFRPGVEIGEIDLGPERAAGRIDIGLELEQVAGDEARGEAELAEHLHQQPGAVAARAGAQGERGVGPLHARLHADDIGDLGRDLRVDRHNKVDRPSPRRIERRHRRSQHWAVLVYRAVRRQIAHEVFVVGEREVLRVRVDEEVERIDDRHVGGQIDLDGELHRPLGKYQPGQPVAVRILLPVDEMVRRRDLQ